MNKYSPFHLFKWSCILFEMAFLYEIVIVTCFWSMIFPALLVRMNKKNSNEHYDVRFMVVAGMCDHSIPLLCLLVEFTYNCTPFVWRHFHTTGLIAIMYMFFNAFFSLFIGQIYPLIDWRSTVGILAPLVVLILTASI